MIRSLDVDLLWVSRNHWVQGQRQFYPAIDAAVVWLVLDGRLHLKQKGTEISVGAGELLWQPPGHGRYLAAVENVMWYSAAMRAQGWGGIVAWPDAVPVVLEKEIARENLIGTVLEELLRCRKEPQNASEAEAGGLSQWLMGYCLRQLGALGAQGLPERAPWLRLILQELQDDTWAEASVLAGKAGYSPTQFRVKFREMVGVAPSEYAQLLRGERAKRLLVETDWAVERIGEEVGYSRSAHFIRFFRRRFGMTPLQFRQQIHS